MKGQAARMFYLKMNEKPSGENVFLKMNEKPSRRNVSKDKCRAKRQGAKDNRAARQDRFLRSK